MLIACNLLLLILLLLQPSQLLLAMAIISSIFEIWTLILIIFGKILLPWLPPDYNLKTLHNWQKKLFITSKERKPLLKVCAKKYGHYKNFKFSLEVLTMFKSFKNVIRCQIPLASMESGKQKKKCWYYTNLTSDY